MMEIAKAACAIFNNKRVSTNLNTKNRSIIIDRSKILESERKYYIKLGETLGISLLLLQKTLKNTGYFQNGVSHISFYRTVKIPKKEGSECNIPERDLHGMRAADVLLNPIIWCIYFCYEYRFSFFSVDKT